MSPSKEQCDQALSGVTEVEEAGEVEEDGVAEDNQIGGEGVPDNEARNDEPLEPVGEFSAAGFGDESLEVGFVERGQMGFGKSAKPGGRVGEELFPVMDQKEALEEGIGSAGRGEVPVKHLAGDLFAEPGDGEVGQGDAEAVGEDDLGVGELCDHVSRASDLSIRF